METPDSALLYYCHAPTVEHFCFSDGLVLLEGKERLFAYNEAAAKLWARLRTVASSAHLRDQLSKEYGLPLGRAPLRSARGVPPSIVARNKNVPADRQSYVHIIFDANEIYFWCGLRATDSVH